MSANKDTVEAGSLLRCYVCAILVMSLVSALVGLFLLTVLHIELMTFLSGAVLIGNTVQRAIGSCSIAFSSALAGVLLGSLCMSARNRGLACVTLTVVGLIFYQIFWFDYGRFVDTSKHGHLSLQIPFAAGGLCALLVTLFISWRRSKSITVIPS